MTDLNPNQPNLTALLQRWHDGDDAALGQLIEQATPRLRHVARHRLGPALRRRIDSQDVVQDTLLSFFRGAPRFVVASEGELLSLLNKILERNVLMQDRFHNRQQRAIAREAAKPSHSTIVFGKAPGAGPATAVDRDRDVAHVRLALEMLDGLEHRIITMRTYDGADFATIASACGISSEAVRKRFDRAMPKLRRKLLALRAGSLAEFLAESPAS